MEKQAPLPDYEASRIPLHCAISLNESDKLRLMAMSAAGKETVRQAILASWPSGIQRERVYDQSYEFKLRGRPWSGQGNEAIPSRVLMLSILRALYQIGYVLYLSTDLSKKSYDKDTLFFRYQPVPPPLSTWFSISFNKGDTVRLIEVPPHLIPQFSRMLGLRIQRQGPRECNSHEFKLRGYPFYADGTETVTARLMMLEILDLLAQNSYQVYATVDQSIGAGDNQSETDSWFIRSV